MEKMRLPVSEKQMLFLQSLGVEDREYTREEVDRIVEDVVADHLMLHGWKPGADFEETNEIGDMCEDIITALTKKR